MMVYVNVFIITSDIFSQECFGSYCNNIIMFTEQILYNHILKLQILNVFTVNSAGNNSSGF